MQSGAYDVNIAPQIFIPTEIEGLSDAIHQVFDFAG